MSFLQKEYPFQEPIHFFSRLSFQTSIAFLYSAKKMSYSGNYSVIALFPIEEIICERFSDLEQKILAHTKPKTCPYFSDGWFGFLSYDLKNEFEKLPVEKDVFIDFPNICFIRYGLVFVFDAKGKKLIAYARNEKYYRKFDMCVREKKREISSFFKLKNLSSTFSKEEYLYSVEKAKKYMKEGDIFEVNLTQKYKGTLESDAKQEDIFESLTKRSPSHYAAFFKHKGLSIISSSPECFLHHKNGLVWSKPIKGTQHRGENKEDDLFFRDKLATSEKDKAENVMIVDLVRNDLGRVSEIGTVLVKELFSIESFQNVHQMVSTITGILEKENTIFDLIRATFPPGSMTGAPKIRAMEIATELEQIKRGIYSGAFGYIGVDHYMDLSVMIRSIFIKGKKVEFQVGGAIVYDSNPELEYKEICAKGKAIFDTFSLQEDML